MRYPALFVLLTTACTGASSPPRESVTVDFRDAPTAWVLTAAGVETQVALTVGSASLDFGKVPGTCAPTAELPFTEVQGQPAFAALVCQTPDGGQHHAVLVEVPGDDPAWPAPVGLALVLTRTTADNQVALMTLGMQELPLGVTPVQPKAQVAVPAEPAAVPDTDG